ncbi:hypothetical protein ANO14919_021330 [Xylariales sp. No.14919]|nr:hypothetical protein F5X98DRAFT_199090 [Xylaria grammica]GAW12762.1 hypothetical protein ANO14919_021330 [Xylariales sp. No.14919]
MSSVKPQVSQSAPKTFKDRLDEAARESRRPTNNRAESSSPSLIEKVAEYVPAASGLLGANKNNQEKREEALPSDVPGPPNRPEHDDHIAEFVREQHRSKKPDGSIAG